MRYFLQNLGTETEISSSFIPTHDISQIFNRSGSTAHVFNQFASVILKYLINKTEDYLELKGGGMACKLNFQAQNALHHHILLLLEGDGIEDLDKIDKIISDEL